MALLHDLPIVVRNETEPNVRDITDAKAQAFWAWYREHLNEKRYGVLIFGVYSRKVRVRDVRKVYEDIFGEGNV